MSWVQPRCPPCFPHLRARRSCSGPPSASGTTPAGQGYSFIRDRKTFTTSHWRTVLNFYNPSELYKVFSRLGLKPHIPPLHLSLPPSLRPPHTHRVLSLFPATLYGGHSVLRETCAQPCLPITATVELPHHLLPPSATPPTPAPVPSTENSILVAHLCPGCLSITAGCMWAGCMPCSPFISSEQRP